MTVQRAVQELTNRGLVVGRQGQGVFVRTRQGPPIPSADLANLADLADQIAKIAVNMSQVSDRLRAIVDKYR